VVGAPEFSMSRHPSLVSGWRWSLANLEIAGHQSIRVSRAELGPMGLEAHPSVRVLSQVPVCTRRSFRLLRTGSS
jgi:hypothetical protein